MLIYALGITSLIASVAIQLGLVALPNSMLSTLISTGVLFVLPGFLFSELLLGQDKLSLIEKLATSFVLGIGLLIIPGTVLLAWRASLTSLIWVSVGTNVILIVLHMVMRPGDRQPRVVAKATGWRSVPKRMWCAIWGSKDPNLEFVLLSVVLVILIAFLLYFIKSEARMWGYGTEDGWSYAPYVRRYVDDSCLNPDGTVCPKLDGRVRLSTWLALLALVGRVSQANLNDMYWLHLTPIFAGACVLSSYTLAKTLFRRTNAALFASLVQMGYYATSMIKDTHHCYSDGLALFARIHEDKWFAVWVVFPIALVFAFRYLETRRPRYLAGFVLSAAAATIIHPMGYASLGLGLASFALVHVLSSLCPGQQLGKTKSRSVSWLHFLWHQLLRGKTKFVAFGILFVILGCLLIHPWLARQALIQAGSKAFSLEDLPNVEYLIDFYNQRRHLVMSSLDWYRARSTLLEHPVIILALLLTPALIKYLRRDWAAQFLFSNMVLPLIVIYNPLTAPLLGKLIPAGILFRVRYMLPISLVVGFVLYKLIEFLRQRLVAARVLAPQRILWSALPLCVVAGLIASLHGMIGDGISEISQWVSVNPAQRDVLEYLHDYLTEESVVLADPEQMIHHLPAFTSKTYPLIHRSWAIDSDVVDNVEYFYDAELVDRSIIDTLRRYDVRYVIIEGGSSLGLQFRLLPYLFPKIYHNDTYELYEVASELRPNHVITGNTYLVGGEWDKAIAEYEAALTLDPDCPLAHLGLSQVYQARSEMEIELAKRARATADLLAHLELNREYQALAEIEIELAEHERAMADLLARLELNREYQALAEMEKAVVELDRAVAASPENAGLHFYVGQTYANLAEMTETGAQTYLQKAAEAYRRSWALNWENTTAGEELMETCEKLETCYQQAWCQQPGMLDEVIAHFEKAVELNPEDGELQLTLARCYKAAGCYEEAIASYLAAADVAADGHTKADLFAKVGQIYEAQGQIYEAQDQFDKAIVHYLAAADVSADGPLKADLLEKAGQLYEAQGQLDKAIVQYLTAAQATADSGTTRRLYRRVADVYLAAGNPEAARSLVRSVLWNEPRNAGSWSLAMDAYPALIEWYEAQEEMTRARAMAWELLAIVPKHEAALQAFTYYDFIANFSAAEVETEEESSPHVKLTDGCRLSAFTMPATGDQRSVLLMSPEAQVSYRLKMPSEPSVLRFGLAMNPETWELGGDGSTFEVYVTDEGGAHRSLFSEHISNDPEDQKWHDREVSLAPYASQEVTITFVTQPGPGADSTGDEAGWATPRVMWARTEERDFWDYSEEEISAADTLKRSPESFTTLYPLD